MDLPTLQKNPHTIQLVRHARALFAASGVLAVDPDNMLWRELEHTLEQAELRLTWPRTKRGRKLLLEGAVCRGIEDLGDYFPVTRQAVIRQLLRQTPREAFPIEWVAAALAREAATNGEGQP